MLLAHTCVDTSCDDGYAKNDTRHGFVAVLAEDTDMDQGTREFLDHDFDMEPMVQDTSQEVKVTKTVKLAVTRIH